MDLFDTMMWFHRSPCEQKSHCRIRKNQETHGMLFVSTYGKINAHIIILSSLSHLHPDIHFNNVVEKNKHLGFSDRFPCSHNVYHLLALSCCSKFTKLWQLRPALAPCIFCLHLVFDTLLCSWQTITGLVLHV